MKRGTASRVVIGGNTMLDLPKGLVFGTDVILGGIAGLTSDFNGLVLSNTLMLGKKISHISVITVIVRGQSPLNLPYAIADSLHYVKAFGGSEFVPENYIDSVTVDGKCEQRNLSSGYTQLEYIESTGTQYIDTGVYISTGYKVRVKAYATSVPTTTAFFGCTSDANASDAKKGIYRLIGSTINRCAWGNGSGSVVGSLIGNDSINTWYDMVCDNGVWTINDTLFATCPESSFTSEYSMWLFARNTGGTVGLPASCRISVCQIWDNNGQMIRNLVPCKNASNVVGMYDLVNGVFYQNGGTGDFAAGGEAVPTPDTPMDIVCNNGVLKARHQSGLPLGYTLLDYIESTGTQYIDTGILNDNCNSYAVKTKYNYTSSAANSLCGDFESTPYASFGQIYLNNGQSAVYSGVGNVNKCLVSGITTNTDYTDEFTIDCVNGTISRRFNGNVYNGDDLSFAQRSPNTCYLFACYRTGEAAQFGSEKIYYFQIFKDNVLVLNLIPAKNSSNVVGMYDLVSGQFFTNQGTGTFTAGNTIDDLEIYTDGTAEVLTDNIGNTASVENIFSVGDYKDTHEILSGVVTRNVGVKVLDGTEGWVQSAATNNLFYATISNSNTDNTYIPISSHFQGVVASTGYATMANGQFKHGSNANSWYFKNTDCASAAEFSQFLANQYNAGTPVIVIYPLATATTETVTGQKLVKAPVTETSGSLTTDITTVATDHTVPTPTLPLDIRCNNGVLKYGNVSKNLFDEDYPNLTSAPKYKAIYVGDGTFTCSYTLPNQSNNVSMIYFLPGNVSTGANNGVNQVDATHPRTVTSVNGYVTIAYRNDETITLPGQTPEDYNCMIEKGPTATPYEPYRLAVYTDGTAETINVHGKNLFDKNHLPERIYAYFVNSGTTWTYAGSGYSLRFPCLPNTTYTARYNGNSTQVVLSFASTNNDTVPTSDQATVTVTQAIRQNTPTINTPITLTTGANDKWLIVTYNAADPQNTDMANNLQIERGSTATTYAQYYDGGTATCEDLLSVGSYTDVQEVIAGDVTRKVGIKVLNGTESWTQTTTNVVEAAIMTGQQYGETAICSHLTYSSAGNFGAMPDNSFKTGTTTYQTKIYCKSSMYATDTTTWKQWLAAQYAAGTPVIVVYPLATATTESVAGQTMNVQEGNNILEITQASMDGLELEASYDTGVVAIIQEVQDVNLNNNVTVTIE